MIDYSRSFTEQKKNKTKKQMNIYNNLINIYSFEEDLKMVWSK